MGKNFKTLQNKMSPAARVGSEAKAQAFLDEMALDELRIARKMTQERLAQVLHKSQAAVSKIERRADMYVSTLQEVVKAMGGMLEIRAVFPEAAVVINQFEQIQEEQGGTEPERQPIGSVGCED
ncbi:MAG TPA: helix-turn-helix transcriptional regulator [Terracidiphilus sp.]|nr:helix-turn-helix transcriptional regulator [Terracidiphilus sp.]